MREWRWKSRGKSARERRRNEQRWMYILGTVLHKKMMQMGGEEPQDIFILLFQPTDCDVEIHR